MLWMVWLVGLWIILFLDGDGEIMLFFLYFNGMFGVRVCWWVCWLEGYYFIKC